jgi:hypothetical protein
VSRRLKETNCSWRDRCVGLKAFRELIYDESHVPLRPAGTMGSCVRRSAKHIAIGSAFAAQHPFWWFRAPQ